MHLARHQRGGVEGVLQAPGQGDDEAQRRDPDGHARRRQRRAQGPAAGASEPDLQGVPPLHARRRVDGLLAAHRRLAGVELDGAPVDHAHHAARVAGDLGVVGDEDHGGASTVQVLEELEHPLARCRVKAAGRLVGEDQPRPVGQGARNGYLLLLPPGEAAGARARTVFQADEGEQVPRPLAALLQLDAGERQGERNVVLGRHRGDEVERLEDRADPLQPVVREVAVGKLAQRQARAIDMARRGAVEAAHQGQERALAAARRAHDGDELAWPDVERDVPQCGDVHLLATAELA